MNAPPIEVSPNPRPHLSVRTFVWSVWFFLLAFDLIALARAPGNALIGEDWYVVKAFTGQEDSLPKWLWAQNNEHRIPLPKLILVAALKASRGDYRAVPLLNIALL